MSLLRPQAPTLPARRSRTLIAVQTLTQIRELLGARGLAPRKALGQHFLIDQNLTRALVDAAGVGPGDRVLEVGPGTGTLTEELLSRGCRVVACELDPGLCDLLRDHFDAHDGFTLIEGDCLESKHEVSAAVRRELGSEPFRLVANLPYNAATPLMLTLLLHHPECGGMYVTIQREVADRLTASPGSPDYGLITVVTHALARVRRLALLRPECFWPRPEVQSAMVAVERIAAPLVADAPAFAAFTAGLFASRRKQLGAVLGRDVAWPEGVTPTDRAESIAPSGLAALFHAARRG